MEQWSHKKCTEPVLVPLMLVAPALVPGQGQGERQQAVAVVAGELLGPFRPDEGVVQRSTGAGARDERRQTREVAVGREAEVAEWVGVLEVGVQLAT